MEILVTGISRSGTTLLASVIGGHPDISILNEPLSTDYRKAVGKQHSGLKVTLGSNITMKYIYSPNWFLSDALNRLINPFRKMHLRWLPIAGYSLNQLIRRCDGVIIIERNKEDVISSAIRRTGMPLWVASRRFKKGTAQQNWIKKRSGYLRVQYEDLVRHPTAEIETICGYLGIEVSDAMLKNASLNPYGKELVG